MRLILIIAAICILATLAGCDGAGGGGTGASSFTSGSGFSGSGSGIVSGSDSGSGSGSGSGSTIPHSPEPVTLALLGTGLAAFVLLRRKKK